MHIRQLRVPAIALLPYIVFIVINNCVRLIAEPISDNFIVIIWANACSQITSEILSGYYLAYMFIKFAVLIASFLIIYYNRRSVFPDLFARVIILGYSFDIISFASNKLLLITKVDITKYFYSNYLISKTGLYHKCIPIIYCLIIVGIFIKLSKKEKFTTDLLLSIIGLFAIVALGLVIMQ